MTHLENGDVSDLLYALTLDQNEGLKKLVTVLLKIGTLEIFWRLIFPTIEFPAYYQTRLYPDW